MSSNHNIICKMRKAHLWLFVAGMLFCLLNLQIPKIIDDYPYSRSFVGITSLSDFPDIDAKIESIGQLIDPQTAHYLYANGRAPIHTVVQVFCCWGNKLWFDLLQGVLFMAIIMLLSRLGRAQEGPFGTVNSAGGSASKTYATPYFGMAVITLFMLGFADPNCLYNGIAYSVNYTWTLALCLATRWLYLRAGTSCSDTPNRKAFGKAKAGLLVAMAFLAGWSNEALAFPLTAATVLEAFIHRKRVSRVQGWAVAAMCLGLIALIAAPSNFTRLDSLSTAPDATTNALPWHLQCLPKLRLVMLWATTSIVSCIFRIKTIHWQRDAFCLAMMFSAVAFSIAIGGSGIRQNFGAELCAAILIARGLSAWLKGTRTRNIAKQLSAIALCTIFLAINIIQRPMSQQFNTAKGFIEKATETDITLSLHDISLPMQIEKYRCGQLSDFQLEQFQWYYGKHSIRVSAGGE